MIPLPKIRLAFCVPLWILTSVIGTTTHAGSPGEIVDKDGSNEPSNTKRPNIVWIISDDQAYGDYGFMGHDAIRTPNLDRLAREASLFRRGYVPTALCRPSLMSLLTGHYASVHGVTGNDPSPKYAAKQSDAYQQQRADLIAKLGRFESIADRLAEAGYLCHQSGKFWEGSFSQGGFTHGMTRGFPQPGGRHGDDGLKIGRQGLKPIDEFLTLADQSEQPYFLWYAPFLPHSPHNPPERLLKKYATQGRPQSIAKYYAMCEWFDETCGDLMKLVGRHKGGDNVMTVYVCDNGWIQDPDSSRFAPRSKQSPYEGGVRTPIFYHWPGHIAAADRPELATSLDIYPTTLAAAGLSVPDDRPGLNLLPYLSAGRVVDRDVVFGESFAHDIADIDDPARSLLYRWCINDHWKLLLTMDGETNRYGHVHDRTNTEPRLYDLRSDPDERMNVAASQPEVVADLTAKIDRWVKSLQTQRQSTLNSASP